MICFLKNFVLPLLAMVSVTQATLQHWSLRDRVLCPMANTVIALCISLKITRSERNP